MKNEINALLLTTLVLTFGVTLCVNAGQSKDDSKTASLRIGDGKAKESPANTTETKEDSVHTAKMQWWREARFGMFIHWGGLLRLRGVLQGAEGMEIRRAYHE